MACVVQEVGLDDHNALFCFGMYDTMFIASEELSYQDFRSSFWYQATDRGTTKQEWIVSALSDHLDVLQNNVPLLLALVCQELLCNLPLLTGLLLLEPSHVPQEHIIEL